MKLALSGNEKLLMTWISRHGDVLGMVPLCTLALAFLNPRRRAQDALFVSVTCGAALGIGAVAKARSSGVCGRTRGPRRRPRRATAGPAGIPWAPLRC